MRFYTMPRTKARYSFPLSRNGIDPDKAPWIFIYGFFLLHMALFGSIGFLFAYSEGAVFAFNLAFSGFAIFIYSIFYIAIFGIDEIKWLIINSVIGILAIYSQLGWILEKFDKSIHAFPNHYHIIPGIYFVLYTFLLRRALLHLLRAKDGTTKKVLVDIGYVVFTVGYFLWSMR